MPPPAAASVDEELRFHFDSRIEELISQGHAHDEARTLATREFGDVEGVAATLRSIDARMTRRSRRDQWLSGVEQDIRVAWRSARRAPAFTAVVIATFALGIGANTVIFSLLSGVLLRPLPYVDADALTTVWLQNPGIGRTAGPLSAREVLDLRELTTVFEGVEALQANVIPTSIVIDGDAVTVQQVRVTRGMFGLLGRRAFLGGTLVSDGEGVVISHQLWEREFDSAPNIIGRAIGTGTRSLTILGVMPPDFVFPYAPLLAGPVTFTESARVDMWVALDLVREAAAPRTRRNLAVVARVRDGLHREGVQGDVDRITQILAATHPESNAGWSGVAVPLHEIVVRDARPMMWLFFAAVCLVLLVACINIANLLLSRTAARARELAMRAALGAGHWRLLRQTLIESLALAIAGGVVGLLLARWATQVIIAIAPAEIPRVQAVSVDWRVLAFTSAVIVATGALVGLAPALAAWRADVRRMLVDGSRGATGASAHGLGRALVVCEIAFAVALSVGAVLLVRSFIAVLAVNPGFDANQLLTTNLTVPARYGTAAARREFYRELFDRLVAVPGVSSVGGTTRLPLGGANSTTRIAVEGRIPPEGQWLEVDLRRAVGRYFQTMRIPLVRGRDFNERDGPDAPGVAIVNETLARRLFPGEEAVGQQIRLGENAGLTEASVIGVVGDIKHQSLEAAPAAEVYINYLQNPPVAPLIVLRVETDSATIVPAIRAAVLEIDSALNIVSLRSMNEIRADTIAERRFTTVLMASFGLLGLLLSAIGVYGVVALVVSERSRELGIRVALGAIPRDVARQVLFDAARLGAFGVVIGFAMVWPMMPLLATQIVGLPVTDPVTLTAVPVLMLAMTTLAALLPALRAMRADPVASIRDV